MIIRQSAIKTWQECPTKYKFAIIDGLPREQSGSLTYGSVIHDCVLFLEETHDLAAATQRFIDFWNDPTLLDPTYTPSYYVKGTNWKKFRDQGVQTLKNWWNIIEWDSDLTLGREYYFEVPIGNGHVLQGTVDKVLIRWSSKLNQHILVISDYKTNKKVPTYGYLEEDLQFSAYCYASLQPEFWVGMNTVSDPERGKKLYEMYRDLPRYGEWVQLESSRRMEAGERTQRHYNRLAAHVNAQAEAIAHNIFTLNISGETCRYCDFRKPCGLPEIEEEEQS